LIREKYEGFCMPKVQKTPSLSLLLKMNIKLTALTGPPISQYAHLGGLSSSPAGLYKQTSWWEVTTTFIAIALLCCWKFLLNPKLAAFYDLAAVIPMVLR
jgi:hypothetical protein